MHSSFSGLSPSAELVSANPSALAATFCGRLVEAEITRENLAELEISRGKRCRLQLRLPRIYPKGDTEGYAGSDCFSLKASLAALSGKLRPGRILPLGIPQFFDVAIRARTR